MKQPNESPFESCEMEEPEVFDADQPDIVDSMFSNILVEDFVESLRSYERIKHPQPQKSRAQSRPLSDSLGGLSDCRTREIPVPEGSDRLS